MSESLQPLSGSLSARVIRACPTHAECPLECPERTVEDLGDIAWFGERAWHQRLDQWLDLQRKGITP